MARLTILAPAALLLLTACASHEGGPHGGRGGMRGDGFNSAVALVDRGEYQEALPILRCVAAQGPGYEIAQYLAGYSALRLSSDEVTPAIMRDEMRFEGFERLTDAAEAGWPTAQAELAMQYATMDSPEAQIQAGYWAAVYRHNARDQTYGLDRLDDGIETRIAGRLDAAQTEQVEQRAREFVVHPMTALPTTPACQPYLGSAGFGQQRGRRSGGEGGRPPGGGGRGGEGGGRGGGGSSPYL